MVETDSHSKGDERRNNSRVLITGCGGMLGHYTYPIFSRSYETVVATDKELTEPWLEKLDVRDDSEMRRFFQDVEPNLVLHLAAETDCEICEADPYLSWEVNARATREACLLASEFDSTMVFISTAAIFPGDKKEPYTESDTPSPTMSYGFHKLEAEHYVRSLCDKHFIFRAGWMMGAGPVKDKKYTAKILRQILAGNDTIHAVTDKQGVPGYTKDFSRNMQAMVETTHYGTCHMVCSGGIGTRYDVAREILGVCRRPDIKLAKADSRMFDKEYFAPRPASEAMVNERLNKLGMNLQRRWQDVLREYIPAEWPHAVGSTPEAVQS